MDPSSRRDGSTERHRIDSIMTFARLNSGVTTRRGFALAVLKPALKRGATLDCRYRG
jgi:hypothetical protein